ncbi:MAG: translation elongation factor Ts [Planctomycetota bacterium]
MVEAKLVAELRRRTGLPMMKCKEALVASEGDLERAEIWLRKHGLKTVQKVEGLVFLHDDGARAAAVAVLCETDFVANSESFKGFGEALLESVAGGAGGESGGGEALEEVSLPGGGTAGAALEALIGKTRENVGLGGYARFTKDSGLVSHYLHFNGKVAALVRFEGEGLAGSDAAQALGRDLAMHIAFHRETQALDRDGLDAAWVASEKEIFLAQVQDMPEARREAIARGKLEKRLKEVTLLDQPFVKNEKRTVREQVEAVSKEIGTPIAVQGFARISAKD